MFRISAHVYPHTPPSLPLLREDDLETAQFSSAEAQAEMSHMGEKMEAMHTERETAVEAARQAIAALDAAKTEATKATSSADRHQQVWVMGLGGRWGEEVGRNGLGGDGHMN